MRSHLKTAFATLLTVIPLAGRAQTSTQLTLPHLFADGMVLQQQSSVPVWGWGEAGNTVYLVGSWNTKDTAKVRVDALGRWKAALKTTRNGGPYTLEIYHKGRQKQGIILKDILLGEVWVCSGQSNMEWSPANGLENQEAEIAAARYPEIRYFSLTKRGSKQLQDDCDARWEACTPDVMRKRSAVAYYFGKHLHEKLNVPVGLIVTAWGGTPAEVWMPGESITSDPKLAAAKHNACPWWPVTSGLLYNSMVHPLMPYNIAGAIWYQGESNRDYPDTYARTMEVLIKKWREGFGKDFPFYLVQIAPYNYNDATNGPARVREAQEEVCRKVPNTGMVVTNDVGDPKNIHPIMKKPVGERLANMALKKNYGVIDDEVESPTLATATVAKNKVTLTFNHTAGGMVCKDKEVAGLSIAGDDGKFVPAQARIDKKGATIVCTSPQVKAPRFVRYCYDDATIGNLSGKTGLPLAPFSKECSQK